MSARALHTKRERIAEKETQIIDAATRIFLHKGHDGTKMVDIARLANVAEGTLYLYFKNKDALLLAIVTAHWERITAGAIKSISGIESPVDQLRAHANYHLNTIMKEWKLIELSFTLYYSHRSNGHDVLQYKRQYTQTFDRIYQRAVDCGAVKPSMSLTLARDMFFGTLEYSARSLLLHGCKGGEETVEQLMSVLICEWGNDGVGKIDNARSDLGQLTQRLERAVTKLEGSSQILSYENNSV